LFEFVVQIFIIRIDGVPVNLVANFVGFFLSFFLSCLLACCGSNHSKLPRFGEWRAIWINVGG
jgi:hypothetical protein